MHRLPIAVHDDGHRGLMCADQDADQLHSGAQHAVGFLDERFINGIGVRHERIGSCPTRSIVIDIGMDG